MVVAAIIKRAGEILICQRRADGAHPLKWEFPGGKVEDAEEPAAGLARELREELGIEAEIGPEFTRYEYSYPGKSAILLAFFRVIGFRGTIENRVFERIAWARPDRLDQYEFLEGDLALIQLIREVEIDQVQ